jgi:cyclic pyranopterin phosphate synthase
MPTKVIPIVAGGAFRAPAPAFRGGQLVDTLGRPMRDLRISVTDRCNFRCVYCMPREVFDAGHEFLPHSAILSFEEIARLARVFAGLGVKKIRLTGGEPLVRKQLHRLVAMLSELPVELTLTTNGSLLARQAVALKQAGLDRVTVSLDSLDDATFRAMNDADFPVAKVIEGIEAQPQRPRAGEDQHGGEARRERSRHRGDGAALARHRPSSASSSTWTSADERRRMDDVVPSAEVVRHINEAGRSSRSTPIPGGSPSAGAISRREIIPRHARSARAATACAFDRGSLYTCLFGRSDTT